MNKMLFFLAFIFVSLQNIAIAQNSLQGIILDKETNKPLKSASVTIHKRMDSSLIKGEYTDADGKFKIDDFQPKNIILKVTFVGYKTFYKNVSFSEKQDVDLGKLYIETDAVQMKSVVVTDNMVRAEVKDDTTEFNTNAIKTRPNADTEELVKKIPGVTVDQQTGTIKAQGEDVKEVLVNGRQYFGDDPMMAMKNLPADVIDRVQVFDKMNEQAQFTGFDDGSRYKAMNLITKNGSMFFGKLYGGYGYEDKYTAGGNVNWMTQTARVSIIGMSNNINQMNFNFQDILGIFGTGGKTPSAHQVSVRQRMTSSGTQTIHRPPGGGAFGNLSDFFVGSLGGITETSAFGINYNDIYAKKVQVNFSYFLNYTDNDNDADLWRTYFLIADTNSLYNQTTTNNTKNLNHRFNGKVDWDIDTNTRLTIRPNGSLQASDSKYNLHSQSLSNNNFLLNNQNSLTTSDYSGYNLSNELIFMHRFNKKGRSFSASIRNSAKNNDGDSYLKSLFYNFQEFPSDTNQIYQLNNSFTDGFSHSANITYTEPLDTNSQLSFSYSPELVVDNENKSLYQFDIANNNFSILDSSLSNYSKATTSANTWGLGYRLKFGILDLNFNLNYKYTDFTNNKQQINPFDIHKTFKDFLPSFFFGLIFNKNTNLKSYYSVRTNTPSVYQLSPIINNSNPLQLYTGNPDLNQQTTHTYFARLFSIFNDNRSNFFIMNNFSITTDNISNNIFFVSKDSLINNYLVSKGTQVTIPQNYGTSITDRLFTTLSQPLDLIKSTINLNFGLTYSQNPGIINEIENISESLSYNAGLDLNSNISKDLDFSLGSTFILSNLSNDVVKSLNGEYYNLISFARLNITLWKGFFIQLDFNHRYSDGYSDGYNQDVFITNLAIGNRALFNNNFDLKIQVFDLFNKTLDIQRNITESYFEDVHNLTLQRYGLLTLTYYIRPFKN